MKRTWPSYRVRVFEQNPSDATFGFGVVLSGRALNFIAEGDPAALTAFPVGRARVVVVTGTDSRLEGTDALADFVRTGLVDVREAFRKAPDRDRLLDVLKRDSVDTSVVERLA